ncbi:MAG: MBL fold metallo-hydrolase [Clostridia bacterium]|nr:MBL fold metallo-hydrolase [Clostridia bacterium]
MELIFTGTCAYDYSPLLKTEFADRFDKDARRSSSLLVDHTLLIDCGTHTFHSLELLGEHSVTHLLLTHLHCDHYDADNVARLAAACPAPLQIYLREGACLPEIPNAELHFVKPTERFSVGDFTVTALPANHDPKAFPLHYAIERDGKRLFYGTDGAWYLTETYNFLQNKQFDCFVFDGTVGDYEGDYRLCEHNSIPMIRLMLASLRKRGVFAEDAMLFLTHIAPSLHKPHDETAELLQKDGLLLAYDGLRAII